MGQILNRISKIARSYIDEPVSANDPIKNDDDELKQIIDELSKNRAESREKKYEQKNVKSDSKMSLDMASAILGIKKDASIDEIKKAYRKKMMDYHPDRVAGLGEELRELARKKTLEINAAYEFFEKVKGI